MFLTGTLNRVVPLITILIISLTGGCQSPPPEEKCMDALGCVEIAAGEPIKIGVLQALTGKVAPLGQAQIHGLELALDSIDNQILGHPIQLQTEDTGCTVEGGANAALKVIADPQTVAIFGTTCSAAAGSASKAMSDSNLTMISGNNSASPLTSMFGKVGTKWQRGFFRSNPNQENAGITAATFAYKELGLRTAATIHDSDLYTKGLADSFSHAFTELGGSVVQNIIINKGETSLTPAITAIANTQPEILFFPLFQPEANQILLQSRTFPQYDDITLITGGALIEQSFLENVGIAASGMYFISPVHPSNITAKKITALYIQKYGKEPAVDYFLSAYDAARLLFHAIERSSMPNTDGTLLIGRKKIRDTLYATKDFNGATGTLSCDQFGDCATTGFQILRLDNLQQGLKGLQTNIVYPLASKE